MASKPLCAGKTERDNALQADLRNAERIEAARQAGLKASYAVQDAQANQYYRLADSSISRQIQMAGLVGEVMGKAHLTTSPCN